MILHQLKFCMEYVREITLAVFKTKFLNSLFSMSTFLVWQYVFLVLTNVLHNDSK